MKFIADFHLHSKYSRATSPQMNLHNLDKWAKIKGLQILGTGDFTHPQWLQEIKQQLIPAEPGLYKLKYGSARFMLTAEISCIYCKNKKTYKNHLLILAPTLEIVDQINKKLSHIGNLSADGRPILGLDVRELVKIVLNVSGDNLVIPAHCLLPNTYLHIDKGIRQIKGIKIGTFVYTHKGRLRKVTQVFKRSYKGPVYTIKPFYFRLGLTTTPEHPFLILRNQRYRGESSYYGEQLKRSYFKVKKPIWVAASKVRVGDILLFPRLNKEIEDKESLNLNQILNPVVVKYRENKIAPIGFKVNWLPNTIPINRDFCRLAGYYLAEGYTNGRDAIAFCFGDNEKNYINDLQLLMKKIFGLKPGRIYKKKNYNSTEFIYFSKILVNIFEHLFYTSSQVKRAHTKTMPEWMLQLPLEKQVEIFKGWWRGDRGYTVSRILMNQIKVILLRLGVIPSIHQIVDKKRKQKIKCFIGKRRILAKHNGFWISNLSFFEDKFSLLTESEFTKSCCKTIRRNGWIDKDYVYLPIRDIERGFYQGKVYNIEVEGDNSYLAEFATIHNCWTPWFSLFGSRSGFNSVEECFEDYSKHIYALETGLSSSPEMNWRVSQLDKYALLSNSDAHNPDNIGREANVFETELNYFSIIKAIKDKDPQKFLYTIEFFPQQGKYHYDGHKDCNLCLSPTESKKYHNICPKCNRPIVIGVLNRVEELADRHKGVQPQGAIPYKSLVPLKEIIAHIMGCGVNSKKVEIEYNKLIKIFDNEFNILITIPLSDLIKQTSLEIAQAIIDIREGKIDFHPGYDGVYGKIILNLKQKKPKQTSLFQEENRK
jgi:uncharacterized protein (TIGR00375 family)